MTDTGDWDDDGGEDASAPVINGGLLDPRTFPTPWPPADGSHAPSPSPSPSDDDWLNPPAPPPGSPEAQVHAEVLNDIRNAQAKLPPIGAQAADDAGSYGDYDLQRPPSAITGPLRTDVPDDVMQDVLNAQAGLPPVRPHPETWSINGRTYNAVSAGNFDPALSNGVTSMPTPAQDAAAWAGRGRVAVADGPEERAGFISQSPERVVRTPGRAGQSVNGSTFQYQAPRGYAQIHGHIDSGDYASDGMVDAPSENGGLGDSWSLIEGNPAPMATVSHGQVGWHVLDNGQLKFLYPPGSMTPFQIGLMRGNLNRQQEILQRRK